MASTVVTVAISWRDQAQMVIQESEEFQARECLGEWILDMEASGYRPEVIDAALASLVGTRLARRL